MSFLHPQPHPASSASSHGASGEGIVLAPLSPKRPSIGNNYRRQASPSSQHSTGGLQAQRQEKVYYDDSDVPIPPFLQVSPKDDATQQRGSMSFARKRMANAATDKDGNLSKDEPDVAAGSVLQRVSSFNLLSRVTSHPKLIGLSSAADGAAVNESGKNAKSDSKSRKDGSDSTGESQSSIQPSWRLRDRMKTAGVGLIMALNVGTDPPDLIKPHPCAKLQCWMDPSSVTRVKAKEKIGELLEAQYAKWQQQRSARPLKYRRALDPTIEDVRALCLWLRKQARGERILLHYNGHGVPRPTSNGEIWVFDKNHTEYIPLSVCDLRHWAGSPTICILDCSSAGVLIPLLTAQPVDTAPNTPVTLSPSHSSAGTATSAQQHQRTTQSPPIIDMDNAANLWVKDMMVLCPTSDEEWLPMDPDYPADIFTSCLTTPIQIALRWFVRNNRASMGDLDPDVVDDIPGQANDRKTPIGELNWIFTAITDSIAWNVLPTPLFQRLFRQDLLVASMFRNFLLADRILRSMNCTPQSYPPLPPGVADHPLWYAWDLACENCLFGLLKDGTLNMTKSATKVVNKDEDVAGSGDAPHSRKGSDKQVETNQSQTISSPFFTEQLTAFEVWLDYASFHKGNTGHLEPPEQLPVVLQVLLSQIHRVRALELLQRFLEIGPWAINLSLSLGIFPYVMKLLQSAEYKTVLVNIWASILKFDPTCQVDLVKDKALGHFIQPLANWASNNTQNPQISLAEEAKQRVLATFCLAATCFKYPTAQKDALHQNLHIACNNLLMAQIKLQERQREQAQLEDQNLRASGDASKFELLSPMAREWICLCLGNLVKAFPPSQAEFYNINAHSSLIALQTNDENPHVRAAATYALGCLMEYLPPSLTSSSSSSSLSGEGGPVLQMMNQPAGAMGYPSPISLGPQAFSNAPPSQIEARGQMAATRETHMLMNHQASGTAINAQSVSSALDPRSVLVNPATNNGTQQVIGGVVQQHIWSGGAQNPPIGNIMVGGQNLQPLVMHQQGLPGVGSQLSNQPIANMQGHGAYQGVPIMDHSSQPGRGQQHLLGSALEGQIQAGPLLYAQQGGIMFHQRYPVQTGVGVMASGHSNMMTSSSQSYPIGVPLVGSPIGGTHNMAGRPTIGPGFPDNATNQQVQTRRRPSVFEDRRRLEFDMKAMESNVKCLDDGNAHVRYEIIMALSCFVEKYLQAFLVVAEDGSRSVNADAGDGKPKDGLKSKDDSNRVVPLPQGVNQLIMDRFERSWRALRDLQHSDPHPKVSEASSTIVRVVHETLLDMRVEKEASASKKGHPSTLSGIQEEGDDGMERATSEVRLSVLAPSTPHDNGANSAPQSDGPVSRLPSVKLYPLRRSASETTCANIRSSGRESCVPPIPLQSPIGRVIAEKSLPKSSYYSWKTSIFRPDYDADGHGYVEYSDPLNPLGAVQSYRRRRNVQVREGSRKLAEHFLDLVPRAPTSKKSLDALLDENGEDDDDRYEALKNELRMKETMLLRTDIDAKMTSMLKFHSYENALVSCDNEDSVNIWNYEKGERSSVFKNGNPEGSRMTSAFWINEESSSLFFVGCDDGSARVWKGILESNGQVATDSPSLVAAFFAIPGMEPGIRGKSGLICEWQQTMGTLIAGGSSKHLHCWDLESEKCAAVIDSETSACITSLTTAWDEENKVGTAAYRGMGPEVIVAGHSDGSLKVFDVRMPRSVASLYNRRTRRKPMNSRLTEHGSWIVDTCFTSYGGKGEIISGSVAGDVRAWDLRMSSSSRAILAQRSPMTALAVHKRVPVIFTGSHAQFIKILTLEGEALQVVRFHEAMPGHRIGPVSCLEFHKEKLVLAAGSTNSLVNIYKPRNLHQR
ncbi:Raptor N-terminal caspase like domain containing protein [Nitzschia inconspicua]|uniref:Raptor N-terminal caspase like domain containing protein n=1 Tax=Nitzschia inconspicua TaxID=303405 RepID=A0A9K3M4L4_9STRA|nr:Raptor N-terminal caspase like domain containing protein [Nitzschia inconspicua]